MQCHYNVVNFFQKYSQKTTHSSPIRPRYGVSFVDPASDWYFASLPVIIYVISYNIGPCHNGTRLYSYLVSFLDSCSLTLGASPLSPCTIINSISLIPWHWHRVVIFTFREERNFCISQSQYHGFWWPGSVRSQGISSHVDLMRNCSIVFLKVVGIHVFSFYTLP